MNTYFQFLKVVSLILTLILPAKTFAEADDFLKDTNLQNKKEDSKIENDSDEKTDEKQIEKWVKEVEELKKEYKNLYKILDENKASKEFQKLGISSLPYNFIKRNNSLMTALQKISEENPFKSQIAESLNLETLANFYLENNGKINTSSESAITVKRMAIELYSKKDFHYKNDVDPYYLNRKELINNIIDDKKTDRIKKIWSNLKIEDQDNGFSLDENSWKDKYTLTSNDRYNKIYQPEFSSIFDGKQDILRLFDLRLIEEESEESKTEKNLLEITKKLVPKDSIIEYFYKKSNMDSSKYYSWESVIVLSSKIVGQRFHDSKDESDELNRPTSFFQVEYDFYDYNPVTDKKINEVKNIRIRHINLKEDF